MRSAPCPRVLRLPALIGLQQLLLLPVIVYHLILYFWSHNSYSHTHTLCCIYSLSTCVITVVIIVVYLSAGSSASSSINDTMSRCLTTNNIFVNTVKCGYFGHFYLYILPFFLLSLSLVHSASSSLIYLNKVTNWLYYYFGCLFATKHTHTRTGECVPLITFRIRELSSLGHKMRYLCTPFAIERNRCNTQSTYPLFVKMLQIALFKNKNCDKALEKELPKTPR